MAYGHHQLKISALHQSTTGKYIEMSKKPFASSSCRNFESFLSSTSVAKLAIALF